MSDRVGIVILTVLRQDETAIFDPFGRGEMHPRIDQRYAGNAINIFHVSHVSLLYIVSPIFVFLYAE